MVAMIDLNTTEDDGTVSSGTTSPSSSAASHLSGSAVAASGLGSVCLELWHACAGPLISLPRRGSVMVYFPQGHLEQLPNSRAIPCDFPPHIFCRVLDVKLHADAATDEVYAQVSLVPEIEKLREGRLVPEGYEEDVDMSMTIKSTTSHMFCKTLTASDTSTHGGFSVPRRAAEDCFPPLDYTQQRPSHELVAKDLIGKEWRFRHIYRGQPRRHLLTTGWSAFVNKKKLVSGDAVLFLRGDDGELRLGIRRAAQIKFDQAVPSLCSQHLNHNSFTDVRNSISLRSVFSICYNPRATSSEFIIPIHKFLRSIDHPFSAGMRFKMRLETEDSAERRLTGIIAGLAETDPVGWPGSKWKCLVVRWDDMEANRLNRVSPWEIEPSGSISGSNSFTSPGLKRTRTSLTSANPEFMVPDVNAIGASDTRESSRFWKVLQGQEILGNPVPSGVDFQNQHSQWFPGSRGIRDPFTSNFEDSFRFRKVLQGQEMLPIPHYGRAPDSSETCEGFPVMSSRNGQRLSAPSMQVSSPPSVLMFQQTNNPVMNINQANTQEDHLVSSRREGKKLTSSSFSECGFRGNNKSDLVTTCKNSCRLFGFSLTEEMHVSNIEGTTATLTPPLNNGSPFAARAQFDENGTDCPNVFVQHRLEAYNIY